MNDRRALIALAHVVEPADPAISTLVERVGPVDALELIATGRVPVRHAKALQGRWRALDLDRELEKAHRGSIRIIERGGEHWPEALDDLGATRPFALWVRGAADPGELLQKSVAMVGTRDPSSYGQHVARTWSAGLVDRGYSIVSGGAFGIDAAAHRAVLDVGGRTMCVLASGVDVAYPSAHAPLFERIAQSGLVVSEAPLGFGARRQRFLTRNRVIAASTSATIVVEAAHRSGTTSTAHAAARLARLVFAVPGPVTSVVSAGCHRLISEQVAMLAASLGDVLQTMSPIGTTILPEVPRDPRDELTSTQATVLDAIPPREAISFERLATTAGLDVSETALALATLQRLGFVAVAADGWRLIPRG